MFLPHTSIALTKMLKETRERNERWREEEQRQQRLERARIKRAIGTYSVICPKCGEGWKLYCDNCDSQIFDGSGHYLKCQKCKESVRTRLCACGCKIREDLYKRTDKKQTMLLIDALYRNSDKQKEKEIVKKIVKYRDFNYLWVFNALESKDEEKLEEINLYLKSIDLELFNRLSTKQKMLLIDDLYKKQSFKVDNDLRKKILKKIIKSTDLYYLTVFDALESKNTKEIESISFKDNCFSQNIKTSLGVFFLLFILGALVLDFVFNSSVLVNQIFSISLFVLTVLMTSVSIVLCKDVVTSNVAKVILDKDSKINKETFEVPNTVEETKDKCVRSVFINSIFSSIIMWGAWVSLLILLSFESVFGYGVLTITYLLWTIFAIRKGTLNCKKKDSRKSINKK